MFRNQGGEYAAPYPKFCGQPRKAGSSGVDDVIENLVRYRFVKLALITERPNVQLETLELYTALVGNVIEVQRCEVGLTCLWAQAGEFRYLHVNHKITMRCGVREHFELFAGDGGWLVAKRRKFCNGLIWNQ